jgi:hypothetical protein
MKVPQDFDASRPLTLDVTETRRRLAENPSNPLPSGLVWIHRQSADADIYFVANQRDAAQDTDVRFRVCGKAPEIWHPDTGIIEQAGYTITDDLTTVPLHLAERESVFVVFREPVTLPSRIVPNIAYKTLSEINSPWDIDFQSNLGAPATIKLAKLESWPDDSQEGVKYFSGMANYNTTFRVPQEQVHSGKRILLDLGTVDDIAEVSVNGNALGILWKAPYQIDVTEALKPGANTLSVAVTNEWTNRIIGDRLASPEQRILAPVGDPVGGPARPIPAGRAAVLGPRRGFSIVPATPLPSGLIGPVTLISAETR